jgi:hypothetical protein
MPVREEAEMTFYNLLATIPGEEKRSGRWRKEDVPF